MLRTILLMVVPCFLASAESILDFPDFSSKSRLVLLKNAAVTQKMLRLTPAAANQRGAVWYSERQPVSRGFETMFQFRLTEQASNEFGGADGFAFVIQDRGTGALGDSGGSAGFATTSEAWSVLARSIPNSVAVFFDTYRNEESQDPSGNYIGVYSNGKRRILNNAEARIADTGDSLFVDMKDGNPHTVRITYSPGRLAVFLDDLEKPALIAPANLAAALGSDGKAFVGFTAATGIGFQNHDILSWSFALGSPDAGFACVPNRVMCTPDRAIVEERGPGRYHVVLPANLEQGASIANANGEPVSLENAHGAICWDPALRGSHGCNGVNGSSVTPSQNLGAPEEFMAPDEPPGA
jgi:hypothetical protein